MRPRVSRITAFRLTSAEPDRLARFYLGLGVAAGAEAPIGREEMALLGLKGKGRRLRFRIGGQRLDLDGFEEAGRPYPAGVTSADLSFQHLALVTNDAADAWARAEALGAAPISFDGPVTLPASAGGVTAVKFRDPEGHPLEFLQLPSECAGGRETTGILGIDHSAISVSSAEVSRRFYETLGLSVGQTSLNMGATQAALDGLAEVRGGVEVEVVTMPPRTETPHLELLGYRRPLGRAAARLAPNDVAATRIVWEAVTSGLLRDPDGHLHLLERSEVGDGN